VKSSLLRGELTLLYAAPERLTTPRFLALLDSLHERGKLSLFAIDEAHCVSQWGHDFRPEYRSLAVLHERYAGVPRIALTATADDLTRADIVDPPAAATGAHLRQQLRPAQHPLHHRRKKDGTAQLLRFIRDEHTSSAGHDAGIVYCQSRKRVEEVAAHAGGARPERPALPRRPGRGLAPAPPGPLPARRRPDHGGHHRLRHGHRQARRALRGPPGHAQEHRGLLPGNRPRRARRRSPPTPGWPTACRTW
jgi:hypothetical protein